MPNPSLRHCTQPSLAFPERVAFGAALRGGCAAAHRHKQPTDPCFPFNRDDDIRNTPMTLPTILSVSPIPSLVLGASLRDRATLPSPLRGLDPSGGYPSRLHSLRSLRGPLAGGRRPPRALALRKLRARASMRLSSPTTPSLPHVLGSSTTPLSAHAALRVTNLRARALGKSPVIRPAFTPRLHS